MNNIFSVLGVIMIQFVGNKFNSTNGASVNWFLKEQVKALLLMLWIVALILIIFSVIRFVIGDFLTMTFNLVAATLFFGLIFYLQNHEKYYPLISTLFIAISTTIGILGFVINDYDSARLPWFLAIVVLVHYLQDVVSGIKWSILFILFLSIAIIAHPDKAIGYSIAIISLVLINILLSLYSKIYKKETDLKQDYEEMLEKTILERTQELRNLNETLELKVAEEVEQNRQKDKKIFEQDKMIALGDMAGNLAHQWRQPLSVISTSATGILLHKDMGTLDDDMIETMMNSINNTAQNLSKTIDTVGKLFQSSQNLEKFVLKDLLFDVMQIEQVTLGSKNIQLQTNIDEIQNSVVTVDAQEFTQVFNSIIVNAEDIFSERKIESPLITVSAKCENDRVVILIEDNGGGIPEDIVSKIFEPYFTTKHQSQGKGLSLHISYKIVTEHFKGNLSVRNGDCGAIFVIELPMTNII